MKKCNHCSTKLLDDARFCHNCGKKVIETTIVCVECHTSNPSSNTTCFSCGGELPKTTKTQYEAEFPLDFKETNSLAPSIKTYFFEAFQKRIEEEHNKNDYEKYLIRFQQSDLGKKFDIRLNQLAEESYTIHAKQDGQVHRKVDQMLSENFNQILDHFIILEAKELNEVHLNEEILSYLGLKHGEFDLQKMTLDFLDLENETETYYTDFIIMPIKKLKNASEAFLFPEKDEKIILIADQTVFGSCKEGFAITEKGIYWKAHFEKAQQVLFKELHTINREKDWITINGLFFNVNPSLNLKMLKLLKKLKEIY